MEGHRGEDQEQGLLSGKTLVVICESHTQDGVSRNCEQLLQELKEEKEKVCVVILNSLS